MLISIREFQEIDRSLASQAKLDLEISLIGSNGKNEVVLLEADSENHLRKTHARYFETIEQLRNKEKRV
jgi:low affinity Fe/Cu permease